MHYDERGMTAWWRTTLTEHYADFTGRAQRSEFWYFQLVNFILAAAFLLFFFLGGALLYGIAGDGSAGLNAFPVVLLVAYGLYILFALAIMVPQIAVGVRRLHDTGRSGWYMLLYFIPLIGPILLIVWWATESQPGSNRWGPNPKAVGGDVVQHFGVTG